MAEPKEIMDYTGDVCIRMAFRGMDLDDYEWTNPSTGEKELGCPVEVAFSDAISKALGKEVDQHYEYVGWEGRLRIVVTLLGDDDARR